MESSKVDGITRICQSLIDDARVCESNGELQLAVSLYKLCINYIENLSEKEKKSLDVESEIAVNDLRIQAVLGQAYLMESQEIQAKFLKDAKNLADEMEAKSGDIRFYIAGRQIEEEMIER